MNLLKIGLIDVDGHNFPNLALMKISAYHKNLGNHVEWVNYFEKYDIVYMSKVFTFTPDIHTCIQSDKIIKGGTGYDINSKLPEEIECCAPDYSIYPQFTEAYGFLTRGCIRKCPWCIVPQKEGNIKPCNDIENVLQGRKSAILMDNNILASDYGIQQLEKIADLKCKVDFNQGLDARLITDDVARLLSKIKWIRYIRFSCDTKAAIKPLISAIEKLNKYGIKNSKIFVYCLIQDLKDAESRILKLDYIGVIPFAQPYRDFTTNQIIPQWQKDMAHWVNKKPIFKSCNFRNFEPRKGFYCKEYFNT